jgi:hypothetical protein
MSLCPVANLSPLPGREVDKAHRYRPFQRVCWTGMALRCYRESHSGLVRKVSRNDNARRRATAAESFMGRADFASQQWRRPAVPA